MSKKSSKKALKANVAESANVRSVESTEIAFTAPVDAVQKDTQALSEEDAAAIESLFTDFEDAPAVTAEESEMLTARIEDNGETPFVLEPTDTPAEEPAPTVSAAQAPVHIIQATGELGDMMKAVDMQKATEMVLRINTEIDERAKFENVKNSNNANIHKTIKKVRMSLARNHAATFMIAAGVEPTFLNRVLQDGSKYNVYAMQKVADLVDGLVGAGMSNSINIACMRSLFQFQKAGIAFTGEMAKAAASDKIRVSDAIKKHLIRHTVSESTAPTQASSTMQALQTLGVVKIEGSRKHPTYVVQDNAVSRRLKAVADGFNGSVGDDEEELAA